MVFLSATPTLSQEAVVFSTLSILAAPFDPGELAVLQFYYCFGPAALRLP